jgi:translation initiation factor 1A
MPKNGGKKKKGGGSAAQKDSVLLIAEMVDSEAAVYAVVAEVKGHGHFRVVCNDGVERLGVLRGNMRRRVWVSRNDLVLVTKRDFQDGKADIVHKYAREDVYRLMRLGEIVPALKNLYNSFDAGQANGEEPEGEGDVIFDEDVDDISRI